MSTPAPLNTLLAKAIIAARVGLALPPRMGEGARGILFERRMQAEIAERLPSPQLATYRTLRDQVRAAVAAARRGETAAAAAGFAAAEATLAAAPVTDPAPAALLVALGRSWIDQGYAYYAQRGGDLATARLRLLAAMDADEELEKTHGLSLMHIGRVHTVHLWLRLQAQWGDTAGALATAAAVLAYTTGAGATLPVGKDWSPERMAAVPTDLRSAMVCRIAGELGALMAALSPAEAVPALDALALPMEGVAADEMRDWYGCKRAWAAGDSADFLRRAAAFLCAGRGETALWYAVAADLCAVALALRPVVTAAFLDEIAQHAAAAHASELLPLGLRRQLRSPAAYRHIVPTRRFHLVCLGLPRSGTTSLYTLFAHHRAGNEYAEAATIATLVARAEGRLTAAELDADLRRRDHEAGLEMDAASFLHLAVDRLPALFPQARFVIPVRDPATWFDSYMRMLLRWHAGFIARGVAPPSWMASYGRMLFGSFAWEEIATEVTRARHLPSLAERFLTHWATATARVLDLSPRPRRLVLRTETLSSRRAALAVFAGISPSALTEQHHANASPPGPSPIAALPAARLAEMCSDICGAVLARVEAEATPV